MRARRGRWLAAAALVAGGSYVASGSAPVVAVDVTVTVDSVGDTPDAAPGDGLCSDAAGVCTLRAAIEETEALPGNDSIAFAIPGGVVHRIVLGSALPVISTAGGVTIDGYTQPGSSANTLDAGSDAVIRIEIQGAGPNSFAGIDLRSSGSVIQGLALFDLRAPIRLEGIAATGNQILGNMIGTDAAGGSGQTAYVGGQRGVELESGASDNVIGAPGNANRNVIAGNGEHGVGLYFPGTDRNKIQNNLFGLSGDGASRVANHGHAVDINFNSSGNIVGGGPGEGNVISGSELSGVEISHDQSGGTTRDNLVTGNLIGTTPDGLSAPLFAINRQFGVNIEGNARCTDTCDDDVSYNRVENNTIFARRVGVMIWKGANNTVVTGNRIGVLDSGVVGESASTTQFGVLISTGAFDNLIEGNTIRGVQRGAHVRPDNIFPSDCLVTDGICPADASFATFGNTITQNSIDDITMGMGIDLYAQDPDTDVWIDGPQTAPSELSNGGILAPTFTSAVVSQVVVQACVGCEVEVFLTSEPICTLCWEAYGRGRTYLGTATADATGRVTFTSAQITAGSFVTAHATDSDGNTSEHSLRATVATSVGAVAIDDSAVPGPMRATRCSISDMC